MGILDDAIREHLELKRRHGASEEELRQQEVEALGATPGEAEEPASGDAAVAELDHDEGSHDPADGNGGAPPADEPVEAEAHKPPGVEEVAAEPEPLAEVAEEPELEEPELPEPESVEPPPEEEPPRSGDTPPQGFEALDEDRNADEGEGGPEDADVLEDTPDFLQETPEHDRLWFEQKPPRDFDFD